MPSIPKFWKGDAIQKAFSDLATALDRNTATDLPEHQMSSPATDILPQSTNVEPPVSPKLHPTAPVALKPTPMRPVTPPLQSPSPPPCVPLLPTIPSPPHLTSPPRCVTPTPFLDPALVPRVPLTVPFDDPLPRVVARSPFPRIWTPLAPTQILPPHLVANHIFAPNGRKLSIDDLITGKD